MHYQGTIYRPPSEANSILLQVTTGCSHNKCTFCGMYKGQRFTIKPEERVLADIEYAATHFAHARRLFLCDGDALTLGTDRLLTILRAIQAKLPKVTRVGIYANSKSLRSKSVEELQLLSRHGLGICYIGLESGDDVTLNRINKGADGKQIITAATKTKEAGIPVSITVLLGVAGPERSTIHATETGRVLSAIDPEFVGALSLMLEPGTVLYDEYQAGHFAMPEPFAILQELRTMIAATNLSNGLFHANHASNYLPIKAKLPEEKDSTLGLLDRALSGTMALKPEYLRAL
ncbi:radical SAM protein [Desulfobulbus alkaliphilus]|uniref:radical SAM protein n=1 Tax=Desulfobulbus alkaliphilus TaxID=869814 RepID=UPI0019626424|nr:radical SAM protein [Desulfobulbus alkaliphilus]MBM9537590.1 B12-binding domain-containing radical SAM protein [Desulfobulbus alkaliphilus]